MGYLRGRGMSMMSLEIHTIAEQETITNVVGSLKACALKKDLHEGIKLHIQILKKGLLETNPYVRSSLISMYAKCNALDQAKGVMDELLVRDTTSWNALISGYVKEGKRKEAFLCFDEMQREGCWPNNITFICVLKACGDMGMAVFDKGITKITDKGTQAHEEVIRKGFVYGNDTDDDEDVVHGAKVGAVQKNNHINDEIIKEGFLLSKDNDMLGVGIEMDTDKCIDDMGIGKNVTMDKEKCIADEGTEEMFLVGKDINVVLGMRVGTMENIHHEAIRNGFVKKNVDVVLATGATAIDNGKQIHVEPISTRILLGNDVNAMLGSGTMNIEEGKQIYNKDIQKHTLFGKDADFVLHSGIMAIDKGKQVHNEEKREGSLLEKDVDIKLGTDMMAFDNSMFGMRTTSVESSQIQVSGAVIRKESLIRNGVDAVFGIRVRAIDKGKQIHDVLIRKGFLFGEDVDVVLGTAVIAMYAKCGEFADAEQVLNGHNVRNVASWNALIGGYVLYGHDEEAMACYHLMQREGLYPNSITFLCILNVCCRTRALDHGKRFHDDVICRGLLGNDIVLGNALIYMYVKCGAIRQAEGVIYELPIRNVVSWSTLIAGYAQQELSEEAFACFQKMERERISPNHITFVSLLKSCCGLADAVKGKHIHHRIVEHDLMRKHLVLGNAIIDMYVKCSALREATNVFEELRVRDRVSWNGLITGYAQEGHGNEALNYFKQMQIEGISPNGITMISILKVYGSTGNHDEGKQLHDDFITGNLLAKDFMLATALIDMYATCGALTRAVEVLEGIYVRDSVCWTSLLAGYVEHGLCLQALHCFEYMQREGIYPNPITYACILKACANMGDLDMGIRVHKDIVEQGFLGKEEEDLMLGNSLIDMYAKCGVMKQAAQVLDELHVRDEVSWNTVIIGYVDEGEERKGFNCFQCMQNDGLSPNTITFVCILKACGNIDCIEKGQEIHKEIAVRGLGNDLVLANALIKMYVKCDALNKAEQVLEGLLDKDARSFSSLLGRYAREGQARGALKCFQLIRSECIDCDAFTFTCILRACACTGDIKKVKQIHTEVVSNKLLGKDSGLGTVLIETYARWGMLPEAEKVLRWLPVRDVDCWSGLITAYSQQGQSKETLKFFEEMESEGIHPNNTIFLSVLKACGHTNDIVKGKQVHDDIVSKGLLGKETFLGNALVDMYVKCGAMMQATSVLEELPIRDVVSWNTLIGGYSKQGHGVKAIESLTKMQTEGIYPSKVTFLNILKVGSSLDIEKPEWIHKTVISNGMLENDIMLGSALVDMYAKSGLLGKAEEILRRIPNRNVVSWNALITGYANSDRCDEALNCMVRMREEGLSSDVITFICLLRACGHTGAAEIGKKIHNEIVQKGLLDGHLVVGNVLLDMYAKCGLLPMAEKVLEGMFPMHDVVSWNTLIAGYSKQGEIKQALDLLKKMQVIGLSPNAITFQCVLSACRISNLVKEGEVNFMDMNMKHGIRARPYHYSCMVHMFSNAGNFEKALEVMEVMPSCDYLPAWHALLSSSQKWENKEVGRFAFENMLCLDKDNGAAHILMARSLALPN